jgi:hypothetical protein
LESRFGERIGEYYLMIEKKLEIHFKVYFKLTSMVLIPFTITHNNLIDYLIIGGN